MIVTSAAAFRAAYAPERFPPRAPATPRGAFLVTPLGFALAAESAQDNRYMAMAQAADEARALRQHAALARALSATLPVASFPGDPSTPDAVFPNNVFGTAPGVAVVGRMRHAVRRREAARADIRAWFTDVLRYRLVDLSGLDGVAELTGALVIDRGRGIGYCGLSERCDLAGARAMHAAFGLRLTFCFPLAPGEYHANVVLSVYAGRACAIAPDGFADPADAEAIARVYAPRVLRLDARQRGCYCGNGIALADDAVWMSERAADALAAEQRAALAGWGFALRTAPLDELEKAGGSLRCCVGELF
ncbi:MAG TPA: arginine deiminase-related protein [Mizugakiibacter sp.]